MKWINHLKNPVVVLITITFLATLGVTIQNYVLSDFGYTTDMKSFYNNYLIFKGSFFHLLGNQNLYVFYLEEGITDLFKYSPTFALFFGVFAYLPDFIGLLLWNCLNGLIFYALYQINWPSQKYRLWAWAFVLVEFITQTQNSQSNGLVAALLVLTYVFLERKNMAVATLMIVLSVYVKLFGLVGFALFLLYPQKGKAALYTLGWVVLLALLPLLVVSPEELLVQYQNWWAMLIQDVPGVYSPSVAGWLERWFAFTPKSVFILGTGVVLFLVPFTQFKMYANPVFKRLMLASILIWVVIFNHKAESPTFIIAITGVAIWYFSQPKNTVNLVLLILAFVFTQLSPTDLFPPNVRNTFFLPYVIKVVPIILIWVKILFDAMQINAPSADKEVTASKT